MDAKVAGHKGQGKFHGYHWKEMVPFSSLFYHSVLNLINGHMDIYEKILISEH